MAFLSRISLSARTLGRSSCYLTGRVSARQLSFVPVDDLVSGLTDEQIQVSVCVCDVECCEFNILPPRANEPCQIGHAFILG